MTDPSDRRGYQTPLGADLETGFRRLLRFQIKLGTILLVIALVIGGTVAGIMWYRAQQPVTVPDVQGLDTAAVASAFHRAGLSPDYIHLQKPSTTVAIGRVISTEPPAGTEVERGAVIRVTVSCGEPEPGFCNP